MGDEKRCSVDKIDHELLIVGYGTRDGVPVWKVKNQWGLYWGEAGYGYLERGYQGHEFGTCGIEKLAYAPVFSDSPRKDLRCSTSRYGIEIQGATLKSVKVDQATSCCEKCRLEPSCVGYVWRFGTSTCELKSSITGEKADMTGQFPPQSTVMQTKQQSLNQCTRLEENVDYAGNDISRALTANAADCCDLCSANLYCNAYTWSRFNGGSCYLKTARPTTVVVSSPLPDGSASIMSGRTLKCQGLLKDVDLVGKDLKSVASASALDCCAICRNNYPCAAFSWSSYSGGTCWLKTLGATLVSAPDVISGAVDVNLLA